MAEIFDENMKEISLSLVFSYIPFREIWKLPLICKYWKKAFEMDTLWKLLSDKFELEEVSRKSKDQNYLDYFKQTYILKFPFLVLINNHEVQSRKLFAEMDKFFDVKKDLTTQMSKLGLTNIEVARIDQNNPNKLEETIETFSKFRGILLTSVPDNLHFQNRLGDALSDYIESNYGGIVFLSGNEKMLLGKWHQQNYNIVDIKQNTMLRTILFSHESNRKDHPIMRKVAVVSKFSAVKVESVPEKVSEISFWEDGTPLVLLGKIKDINIVHINMSIISTNININIDEWSEFYEGFTANNDAFRLIRNAIVEVMRKEPLIN